MKLVIGSRGSKLALWQAEWVRRQLQATAVEAEVRIIKTTGDKLAHGSITQSGTKGLFVKEIEEALAAGEIDVAVHSLKDMPTEQPKGLHVAAVPPREDPRDVLLSRERIPLAELPNAARIGTSSLRRQAQLRALRPDLEMISIRGNLDTRVRKLDGGECDGLVVAAAGIHRLGFSDRITEYFDIQQMCPAVGQGALAIEVREDDRDVHRVILPLNEDAAHQSVRAERAMLRGLGGGCLAPIAAHACVNLGRIRLVGVVASVDGATVLRSSAEGPADDPEGLGHRLAQELLHMGAGEILKRNNTEI